MSYLKYSLYIAGLFTAAFDDQIEWLIVKGIADYADGAELTAESWRPFASVMAASVVSHILSDPTVFSSWPHYEGKDSHTRCGLMVFMAEGTLPWNLFPHVFYPHNTSAHINSTRNLCQGLCLELCPLVFTDLN